MAAKKTRETLLLIDANSLIHRAYHALPSFSTPEGNPSGALYGLASILIRVMRERPPHYAAAAFDTPEPTHRKKEYGAYKATRAPVADDLIPQLEEADDLLEAFGIKSVRAPGWEADDIVATLGRRFGGNGALRAVILSGDLDTLQVVDGDDIVVEFPKKGISQTVLYDESAVIERFGVVPARLADYKGLVGDTSDNIPGVPGIGPKTAARLIGEYGTLEDMFEDIEEVGMADKKLREKLLVHKDQALLSKRLATLSVDTPVALELGEMNIRNRFNKERALSYARRLGSKTLEARIENDLPTRYNGE